jgi:hypothetical protein
MKIWFLPGKTGCCRSPYLYDSDHTTCSGNVAKCRLSETVRRGNRFLVVTSDFFCPAEHPVAYEEGYLHGIRYWAFCVNLNHGLVQRVFG